jgi:hypothetical protein
MLSYLFAFLMEIRKIRDTNNETQAAIELVKTHKIRKVYIFL